MCMCVFVWGRDCLCIFDVTTMFHEHHEYSNIDYIYIYIIFIYLNKFKPNIVLHICIDMFSNTYIFAFLSRYIYI